MLFLNPVCCWITDHLADESCLGWLVRSHQAGQAAVSS
ncbi:hypothetical protein BLL52_4307 [Rhodoferax antarcticus ANT.BR]|uniref:Uncharacterized protein n=1 Tax=Rhodoferax antarcticus ANT.BR TaxID=1111071 RepID=A0A1Q8Y905_9BURK|nr:hypothetical protein BLL52_4307 [Rhodoferax antarcticus ANT.BR]